MPTRRMLVIVNPYATTMSVRLKHLVVYALQGRFEVEAVDTQRKGHAIELCREAAREGYDVVVAFGGDGTVNEAANGLAGTRTALVLLPGGATNVYCRMLGIPTDVVDATEHLLRLADAWAPRPVDLGRVNDRWFTFSAGAGLDASVVERVDRHPRLKARFGPWYYAQAAIAAFLEKYVVNAAARHRRRWPARRRRASASSSRTPSPTRTSAAGRSRSRPARRSTRATSPAVVLGARERGRPAHDRLPAALQARPGRRPPARPRLRRPRRPARALLRRPPGARPGRRRLHRRARGGGLHRLPRRAPRPGLTRRFPRRRRTPWLSRRPA